MLKLRVLVSLVPVIFSFTLGSAVSAQDSLFYSDKRISLIVGFNPGGGYDSYARAVARHWTNNIPGKPTFIVKNMPGAGSLTAANHLAKVAAKDGTVLGAVNPNLASSLLLRPRRTKLDLRRFHWIGSPARLTVVGVVWHTAQVQSLEELRTKEMIVGGSGGATVMLPTAAKKILGLKFKVIAGYRGTRGSMLAMERGEVQGAGISYSRFKAGYTDWVKQGKAKIFTQFGLTKHPELPNVPMLISLAKTDKQRKALRFLLAYQEMGRPYVAPPGVPAKRVALLRRSFNATMKDQAFLKEAKKRRLAVAIDFPKGQDLQKSVDEIYATPPEVVDYVRTLKLRRKKGRKKGRKKKRK